MLPSLILGFLGAAVFAEAAPQQIDPAALIRQSIYNYGRNWRESMRWKYQQTDVSQADGATETEVSEIAPLDGTPYERLIEKDGHKLSAEDEAKEEKKYQKALKQRLAESPEQRMARIRKAETERDFVKDIPEAYDFQLMGEEGVRGRPAWVIKMVPRPGFVPSQPHGAMLSHIEGTLWLDKEDLQWARAEAHVTETISFGWVLARIGPGARISVEQTRVADGLWMPQEIKIDGAARVLLVHNKSLKERLTYTGFERGGEESVSYPDHPIHPEPGSVKTFK